MARVNYGLVSLPPECTQNILMYFDNVTSICSAILSHSSLYRAFHGARDLILKSVLSNMIPLDLLPEACAVLRASKIHVWDQKTRDDNLDNFRRRLIPAEFSLQDAISMEEFHLSASFFTADFTSMALSRHILKDKTTTTNPNPVTANEWHRVLRSFYWWEWYTRSCRVISNRFIRAEQSPRHLQMFSIWEKEQLASVGEYLFHKITKPFNEVAAHDIKWGSLASEVWDSLWPHTANGFWLQRLPFLQRLVSAETYDQGHNLMDSNWEMTSDTGCSSRSGVDAWVPAAHEPKFALLQTYTEEELKNVIGTPWAFESDNGPLEAWKWTHQEQSYFFFVQCPKLRWLRRRGYVMWNYDRLKEWGLFDLQSDQFEDDMC
ncbi:hypothetical protein N7466_010014 [Penicillium verhagenii]|uniref:uncharacterized protein n=1 Tax=Penicillium verhagenii TaxID=1562060 RepID=UPI00254578FB|nr:uncharacterized protein N7466_010014 [Penicillium verhagenii]KAJ5919071.1 hypothetical protein N7466_010014 [Penicillium verhagenii]